jgi:hypothetical protein
MVVWESLGLSPLVFARCCHQRSARTPRSISNPGARGRTSAKQARHGPHGDARARGRARRLKTACVGTHEHLWSCFCVALSLSLSLCLRARALLSVCVSVIRRSVCCVLAALERSMRDLFFSGARRSAPPSPSPSPSPVQKNRRALDSSHHKPSAPAHPRISLARLYDEPEGARAPTHCAETQFASGPKTSPFRRHLLLLLPSPPRDARAHSMSSSGGGSAAAAAPAATAGGAGEDAAAAAIKAASEQAPPPPPPSSAPVLSGDVKRYSR